MSAARRLSLAFDPPRTLACGAERGQSGLHWAGAGQLHSNPARFPHQDRFTSVSDPCGEAFRSGNVVAGCGTRGRRTADVH